MDRSNGYEGVAAEFLSRRGRPGTGAIGVATVRAWARRLRPGSTALDLGCGSGVPITEVLLSEGLAVHAIDASPSLVAAFQARFPSTPIACEAVEESAFFGSRFDAVLAWGLLFLLPAPAQHELLWRLGDALEPGGRLLFTSPREPVEWDDVMTGRRSRSLGAAEYRRRLSSSGIEVEREYEDEGENHYYDAVKTSSATTGSRVR
jgi:2-polyprenyl-3-methyl-5-hydroxy-6-metoxy-1,4-benzoquinol methylase